MVNLGFVQTGIHKEDFIYFKNEGSLEGSVKLVPSEMYSQLAIDPKEFSLKPNELKKVKFSYMSEESGIFKGMIDVEVDSFYSVLK